MTRIGKPTKFWSTVEKLCPHNSRDQDTPLVSMYVVFIILVLQLTIKLKIKSFIRLVCRFVILCVAYQC